ncbi:nuclear transport factor 2 family protein [Erythrobacteraceae bacterium CFH 75059]|uniref:nuclear transport factor 2 family protein n=1 Tax=Qipengyuania thermophila TaxID=2509361 RepID=UPI001021D638|nr:nuclear transport factor 2 family protein [Qipengyuania thermophila]TCD06336.1 nuclear transport factor 2 family protein [Erythrobacteraceae bacterium CFH 75059]
MGGLSDRFWNGAAAQLVNAIIAAVNARDFDALERYATADLLFCDSRGGQISGLARVIDWLRDVIAADPSFALQVDAVTSSNGSALVTGTTVSRFFPEARRTLWRLTFSGGRVSEWRRYSADPLPVPPPLTAH